MGEWKISGDTQHCHSAEENRIKSFRNRCLEVFKKKEVVKEEAIADTKLALHKFLTVCFMKYS